MITDAPVEGDWVCIACEYPLKGLNRDGACPECGTRIELSLREDTLAHASPLWVMRLAQAATLLCWATVASWLCEIFFFFGLSPSATMGHVLARVLMIATFMHWPARWLLAAPEYVALGRYRNLRWCWAIRICATLRVLFYYPLIPLVFYVRGLDFAEPVLGVATIVVSWLYLRQLARRLPDRSLYAHVPFAMLALIAYEFCSRLLPLLQRYFLHTLPTTPPQVERLIGLLAMGYSAFILSRFSTRFTSATNQAMANYLPEKS